MDNWIGFAVAFVLLAIAPVWFLTFFEMTFFTKVIGTVVMGTIVYLSMEFGAGKK